MEEKRKREEELARKREEERKRLDREQVLFQQMIPKQTEKLTQRKLYINEIDNVRF